MSNEVEKFDPSTLMQGVKDRIKATFVSMIPDDAWDKMVKHEIDAFFKEKDTYYNNRNYTSDFGQVVRSVCTAYAEEKIKAILSQEDFQVTYLPNGQYGVSESIKAKLVEAAPQIFTATIENLVASTVMRMKQGGY